MTTEYKIDESTFAARWLLRHCAAEAQDILHSGEHRDALATQAEQLFLKQLLCLFRSRHEMPDDCSDWLCMETVAELLVFDSDLSPGESLLCLLQSPVARIDWFFVVDHLRNPPAEWERQNKKLLTVHHRGQLVAVDPLTEKKREFMSISHAVRAGFDAGRIRKAVFKGGKYDGMEWGWKAAKDETELTNDDDALQQNAAFS